MKLILVDSDGVILDESSEFTRAELDNMSPSGAYALLSEMAAGEAQ